MKKLTLIASLVMTSFSAYAAEDVIRLGNLKFAHYGAVSYIKEIAPKCGMKVEERMFAKGLDIMPAIIAGEIDVAASAADAAIAGRAGGVPVYAVAGFAKGGIRIVVQPGSAIKTVADFKGKSVGVARGGAQELALLAELAKANLSWSEKPGKDVKIVYLPFADLNQALMQKQIDAMSQSEPQASQAINKGFGVELLKPYETPMGEPIRTLVMSEKLYNGNRPLAEKFMKCFVQATKAFMDDPKLAENYVRNTMFKGQITVDDYQDAIANSPFYYNLSVEHMQITTDFMAKYGVGKMVKPPVAKEWVKLDLLEQAKKSLNVK
ncbi:ABC transporter substrate-binding protein [Iodobacter fluviatilis]|uniref:NitT/TauT family transport system substrate-binding protein n=1 Tax=Iodobacter fluviatilis TaxID=537 RepID=A0A377QA46_9NEIS|nr:ABC transporter substrate-binding protein [Iodobacter fluviatilis]TCU82385.1 NitT/TauT family transport system substrate-binding protein [Iodobacter fluviatilis]STQ91610.1 P-H7 [Iodobacter fluviatilis]